MVEEERHQRRISLLITRSRTPWQFQAFDPAQFITIRDSLNQYIARIDNAARKTLADPLKPTSFTEPVPRPALPREASKYPHSRFYCTFHVLGIKDLKMELACIDHKSSAAVTTVRLNSIRICAECRLWQRSSPAGAGKFRCSFGRMFKNSSFDLCILKSGS
jgi:hypothetical protein